MNTRPITEFDWGESCVTTEFDFATIENVGIISQVIVYAESLPIRFYFFSITQDFKTKFCHRSMHDQEFH